MTICIHFLHVNENVQTIVKIMPKYFSFAKGTSAHIELESHTERHSRDTCLSVSGLSSRQYQQLCQHHFSSASCVLHLLERESPGFLLGKLVHSANTSDDTGQRWGNFLCQSEFPDAPCVNVHMCARLCSQACNRAFLHA